MWSDTDLYYATAAECSSVYAAAVIDDCEDSDYDLDNDRVVVLSEKDESDGEGDGNDEVDNYNDHASADGGDGCGYIQNDLDETMLRTGSRNKGREERVERR